MIDRVFAARLLQHSYVLQRDGLFDLILYLSALEARHLSTTKNAVPDLISLAQSEAARSPLTEGERYVLSLVRAALLPGPALGSPCEEVFALPRLINDGAKFYLAPGRELGSRVRDRPRDASELCKTDEPGRRLIQSMTGEFTPPFRPGFRACSTRAAWFLCLPCVPGFAGLLILHTPSAGILCINISHEPPMEMARC